MDYSVKILRHIKKNKVLLAYDEHVGEKVILKRINKNVKDYVICYDFFRKASQRIDLISVPELLATNNKWIVFEYAKDFLPFKKFLVLKGSSYSPDYWEKLGENLGEALIKLQWRLSGGKRIPLTKVYTQIITDFALRQKDVKKRCVIKSVLRRLERGEFDSFIGLGHADLQVNNLGFGVTSGKIWIFDFTPVNERALIKDAVEFVWSLLFFSEYVFVKSIRKNVMSILKGFWKTYSINGKVYPLEFWYLMAAIYSCGGFEKNRKLLYSIFKWKVYNRMLKWLRAYTVPYSDDGRENKI